MADDISRWLDERGLGRYAKVFAENEIDLDVLPHVTNEDLKEIGVSLGARRKIMAAIADSSPADTTAEVMPEPDVPSRQRTAECRHLTVMFCDQMGSTALSAKPDPEKMTEAVCSGVRTRYNFRSVYDLVGHPQ